MYRDVQTQSAGGINDTKLFFSVFFPVFYLTKIYDAAMIFLQIFFFLALSVSDLSPAFLYFTVKISGFTQFYFVWLKFRISVLMPWLPLGRLLTFMSPAALCLDIDYPKNEEDDVLRNAMLTTKIKVRPINEVLLVSLTLTFPLAIFAMCTFMLLISLQNHMLRMQNGFGFRNASTDVHTNALRTMVEFFFFFISYFATFITNTTFTIPERSQCFFVVKDVMAAHPSGHSVIIILSSSKFRQPLRKLLCLKKNQYKRRTRVKYFYFLHMEFCLYVFCVLSFWKGPAHLPPQDM